jgi:hypothetical protein
MLSPLFRQPRLMILLLCWPQGSFRRYRMQAEIAPYLKRKTLRNKQARILSQYDLGFSQDLLRLL